MRYTINLIFIIISISSTLSYGQKKVLSTNDFASWNRLENRQISNNGNYISYEINEQKGDGMLLIYDVKNESNDTIPFGYGAKFSPNSDFIVFKYKPATDTVRAAKKAEVKKDDLPKDSVGIYNLLTKEFNTYPKVKSFALAKENASWTAILIDHVEPEIKMDSTIAEDTLALAVDSISVDSTLEVKKKKDKDFKELMVHQPVKRTKYEFDHVESYAFAKEGKTLAIATKEKDSVEISTVISFNTISEITDTIFRDTGLVKKLTIDKLGNQLAFLFSSDTIDEKVYSLYLSDLGKNTLKIIADTLSSDLPVKHAPSENGSVYFSDDASKLFFGSALKPIAQPEDSLLDEEKPKVDIWSWTDIELQPTQLLNAEKEKKRTYLATYHIKEGKIIQIADSTIKHTKLINKKNGEVALGWNDKPYKRASSWNAQWLSDYYLIDLNTGQKELILEAQSDANLSPTGQHLVWFDYADSIYYSRNNKSGKVIPLTKNTSVAFYDELNDSPTNPRLYGICGWTANHQVFIYDRYDIWKLDLNGKKEPINISNGFGRENRIRLRYQEIDPELVFLPNDGNILLTGFDENTYQEGIYKSNINSTQRPEQLIKGEYMLGKIRKAKNNNSIIWSTQTVAHYPEIKLSALDFKDEKIISNTNPQQKEYNWATTELVEWTSFTGEKLRGILYKPENFDPNKKYPMMLYFYERSSERIHRHYTPYPSHSIINKPFYASNGYLVFVPDISYKIGYPGQSAYNAIISGTQYLINTFDYIDEKNIGLQGQSWGGYQIAYLVTQTDLFSAAMAGAPVSNMTSAYGGIRWGSGMSRMFQYEHTQSRIGGTLWDKPMLYIENSPVFHAPKVNTPLLMMHNDKDGAVPWYQGIEYFVALRRLNKPAWMLNYNGMKHNIESKYWANRMDLSNRMLQFFNHYLKGEPAPEWMINGLPAIDKGEKLGY